MDNTERLEELVRPKTRLQASFLVHSKSVYYKHAIRVCIFHTPFERLHDGMQLVRNKPSSAMIKIPFETNLERSLRRSKKKISDIVLTNKFDIFATFTFKSDRQDIDKCKAKMQNWLKNQQKRNGKLSYLIVPEFHKDRKSLHFHALINGFKGKLKPGINPKTGKQIIKKGRPAYSIPSYHSGHTDVKKIDDSPQSNQSLNAYLQKYITKDMPTFSGKKRYWASRGFKLPYVEYNSEEWCWKLTPSWVHDNDFVTVMEFPMSECPVIERVKGVLYA